MERNSEAHSKMQKPFQQTEARRHPIVRRGIVLSESLAVEVYRFKQTFDTDANASKAKGRSSVVGRLFNISPKTVRDIWNHITWKYATHHLWTGRDNGETVQHGFQVLVPHQQKKFACCQNADPLSSRFRIHRYIFVLEDP
jgi:hypothetical protein